VQDRSAALRGLDDVAPQLVATVLDRFGEARVRVCGTSMLPAIRPGDVLLIRKVAFRLVLPGDVVLAIRNGRLFAHRVVEAQMDRDPQVLITCGDTHAVNDPPVTAPLLLGRVEQLLRHGTGLPLDRAPRRRLARLRTRVFRHA
jgi:signal peptidase I